MSRARWLSDISIATFASGVILAAMSGVNRSEDGGQTWTPAVDTAGTLVTSPAHPDTVFLIPGATATPTTPPLLRSDDAGLSWQSAVPGGVLPPPATIVVDAPDGGFLALLADYGLVRFD